jgi:hypothetical protein
MTVAKNKLEEEEGRRELLRLRKNKGRKQLCRGRM